MLGTTGAGKSTLLNLLVKNNLEVDKKGRLDTKDPVKGSEIGHEITSTTTFPSLCLGPNDVVFVDFPGFGDSGGEEDDLIHAYVRKKLFSGNFKILLAVEERELDGKPLQFLKVLQDLTKTIPVERLKESLALVVTKQGRIWDLDSCDALKKLPYTTSGKVASSLTEDVKILLRHLTEEDKINTRVPYFPCQKTAGIYESPEVRENILLSINSLIPMTNPPVHFQPPAESTLLLMKLARDLNRDIEDALKTIVKPTVVQLCDTYTTAYTREGSMEGLGNSLKAVQSALALLMNVSEENMGNFPSLFNGFFDQGKNIVKEYVKTLMFLKSLKTDIEYLTPSWAHGLQLTLEEIHGLIDSLGNRLFQKITTFVESIRYVATQCCDTAPESDNEKEVYIEGLTQKLRNIKTAMTTLREASPETMIHFVEPLEIAFPGNGTNTAEKSLGTLEFLSTLKEMAYPKEGWLDILNVSTIHIQKEIDTQQRLIDLNRRLEEERLRQEATRREREETARRHQAEVTRKEEELRHQQEETRRIATEAAERQRQLELRAEERRLEVERQRIADLEEQRRLREEERREAERRASEQQQLQLEVNRQQQQQFEANRRASEQQQQQQSESNRQLLAMLEAQHLAQLQEKQRLESDLLQQRTLLNATKTETGTKLKILETALKKGEETSKNLTIESKKQADELKFIKAQENKLQQALSQQLAEAKQEKQKVTLQLNTVTQEKQKLANENLALTKLAKAKELALNHRSGKVTQEVYDLLPENLRTKKTVPTRKVVGKKVQWVNETVHIKLRLPRK